MSVAGPKIIVHQGCSELAHRVAAELRLDAIDTNYKQFSDNELKVKIADNVRRHPVYIIYPRGEDPNRDFVELLLLCDALKRSAASEINLVIPYTIYSRQDRRCSGREPISISAILHHLVFAGVSRFITLDLHNAASTGAIRDSFDNLTASPLFIKYIKEQIIDRYLKIADYTVLATHLLLVSPDEGGAKRTLEFAGELNKHLGLTGENRLKMIIMLKNRDPDTGQLLNMELRDDVSGKICITVDDMADSCGTLMRAVSELKKGGAAGVFALITHGLLTGPAVERLNHPDLDEIVVTNTVNLFDKPEACEKMQVVDVTSMLASVIAKNERGESMGPLFHPKFYQRKIRWYLRKSPDDDKFIHLRKLIESAEGDKCFSPIETDDDDDDAIESEDDGEGAGSSDKSTHRLFQMLRG